MDSLVLVGVVAIVAVTVVVLQDRTGEGDVDSELGSGRHEFILREWTESGDERAVESGPGPVHLIVDLLDGSISWHSVCGPYGGRVRVDEDRLVVSEAMTLADSCRDEVLDDLAALMKDEPTVALDDDQLILTADVRELRFEAVGT